MHVDIGARCITPRPSASHRHLHYLFVSIQVSPAPLNPHSKMLRCTFVAPGALPLSGAAAVSGARLAPRRPSHTLRVAPIRRVRGIQTPRAHHASTVDLAAGVTTTPAGSEGTLDFRLRFQSAGAPVSPWHDLPLYPNESDPQTVTFVNEIPRGTQAKMEIATDEAGTPIKQDVKKGALRFYQYGPSLVNYGAIPQTWEDPATNVPGLNAGGDGDPLDVTEIGKAAMPFGAVYPVKVLGCLALLDEGEVDWKIIAINAADKLAPEMNDIGDVERLLPGKIDEVRQWFRMYKTAEGKGENEYGYDGEAKGAEFAMKVIEETHQSWADLRSGAIENDGFALS